MGAQHVKLMLIALFETFRAHSIDTTFVPQLLMEGCTVYFTALIYVSEKLDPRLGRKARAQNIDQPAQLSAFRQFSC